MRNKGFKKLIEDFLLSENDVEYVRIDSIEDHYAWDEVKDKDIICYKIVRGQFGSYDHKGRVSGYVDFSVEIYNLKLTKNKFRFLLDLAYKQECFLNDANFKNTYYEKIDSDVYFNFEEKGKD